MTKARRERMISVFSPVVLLVLWEMAARLGWLDARIIPPPYDLPEIQEILLWNPRRTADPPHVWMREQVMAAVREIG